jgi:hypothetical protein
MTDSLDDRLIRLEASHGAQRRAWVVAAAKRVELHDADLAVKLTDRTRIATSGDADRAVEAFTVGEQHRHGGRRSSMRWADPHEDLRGQV